MERRTIKAMREKDIKSKKNTWVWVKDRLQILFLMLSKFKGIS